MTSIPARVAEYRIGDEVRFGLVTDNGIIDLLDQFKNRFTDLQAVVEAGALEEVIAAGGGKPVTHQEADIEYLIPIARPEKIICIGVNFPDRNAEYKDGQAAP